MLQVREAKKNYGTHAVLDIPSFSLSNGIYRIKGANGSGKTTLLKMIAGLLPFEGDILVNNISLKKEPLLYRRQVSWSEAEPLFPSFMSGVNLIDLHRHIRRTSHEEATALIALLNMSGYINDAIGTYSAGMTKKLSLLLSFLGKPPLVVLDEPLITLDAETVAVAAAYILATHQRGESSFIISSHQEIDPQWLPFDQPYIIQNKTIVAA